jgi:hypothetical protein
MFNSMFFGCGALLKIHPLIYRIPIHNLMGSGKSKKEERRLTYFERRQNSQEDPPKNRTYLSLSEALSLLETRGPFISNTAPSEAMAHVMPRGIPFYKSLLNMPSFPRLFL